MTFFDPQLIQQKLIAVDLELILYMKDSLIGTLRGEDSSGLKILGPVI